MLTAIINPADKWTTSASFFVCFQGTADGKALTSVSSILKYLSLNCNKIKMTINHIVISN